MRNLPELLHTSTFETHSVSTDGRATFHDDTFTHTWHLTWTPRVADLGPRTSLAPRLRYESHLYDRLSRLDARGGNAARTDVFDFALRLSHELGPGRLLDAEHSIKRTETLAAGRGSDAEPTSSISDVQTSGVRLDLPYDMQAAALDRRTSTFGTAASEIGATDVSLLYRPQATQLAQELSFNSHKLSSRNLAAGTSNDETRTQLRGYRQLDLGRLGRPQIAYEFRDTTQQTVFEPEPLRTLDSLTQLNWNGDVADFPLRYALHLGSSSTSYSSDAVDHDALESRLHLAFEPPAGERRLAVEGELRHREDSGAGGETSQYGRTLGFTFRPVQRVNSSLRYTLDSSERALELSSEREQLDADLRYELPAGNGELQVRSQQVSELGLLGSNYRNLLSLVHTLKLSDRATFRFGLDQASTDTSNIFNSADSRRDATFLHYSISSPEGLRLQADWRQIHDFYEGQELDQSTQTLNMVFSYRPLESPWLYQLTLASNDATQRSTLAQPQYAYRSEDRVQAVVTFSF